MNPRQAELLNTWFPFATITLRGDVLVSGHLSLLAMLSSRKLWVLPLSIRINAALLHLALNLDYPVIGDSFECMERYLSIVLSSSFSKTFHLFSFFLL